MGINTDAVQRLYVAYFNRPADPAGLTAFEALLSSTVAATQAELEAIATNFRTSQEYIDLYAGMSNAAIVNAMYNNLFGRDCESVTILNTWVNWIADGTYTFEQLALQLTYSAQGTDATVIANKLAASTAFTTAIDTVDEYIGCDGDDCCCGHDLHAHYQSGQHSRRRWDRHDRRLPKRQWHGYLLCQ